MGSDDAAADLATRNALARWFAVGGFAVGRLLRRTWRTAPRQILAILAIVALAITLLLVVTGISLELADDRGVETDGADYRIVPEEGSSLSAVIDVEGPRLGDVHERTVELESHGGVAHATPVFVDVVRLRAPDSDDPVAVVAIGVVPDDDGPTIAGLETSALGPGDPHYANGSYDGEYTGDLLLSRGAADQLNASVGDRVLLQSGRTGTFSDDHAVTEIEEASAQTVGSGFPIAVFRLSELQSISGAADGDLADQVVVRTDGESDVRTHLEATFDEATVTEADDDGLETVRNDEMATALSLSAAVVGIGLCVLFVTTTMGLAIEGDRRTLAVLAALGFAERARFGIVAVTILSLTLAGAAVGLVLAVIGVAIANAAAQATVTNAPIASIGVWAVPYAAGVAVVSGALAVPYPLVIAARTDVLDELGR